MKGRLLRTIVAGGMAVGMLAATSAAASASYTWSKGGVSRTFAAPGPAHITTTTVNNNTSATMKCWQDGPSWTGVYKSNRWFKVRLGYPFYITTWMHSSNIYDQTSVGRC